MTPDHALANAYGESYVDLHTHSTASDGVIPPTRVVEAAKAASLSAIALTDHDTLDGLPAAIEAGERLGVRIIPGCELSAYNGPNEIHLLVLHIADLEAMRAPLATFRAQRSARAEEIVHRLIARHVAITMDDVIQEAGGGAIGRPHVARALVRRGHAVDLRDAFDRYLALGRPAYVPKPTLDVADAIAIAHNAGGLAIWAHPAKTGTREKVRALMALGLDGVEVRHPSHTEEDIRRIGRLVEEHDLIPSGGSDWHGTDDGYRSLGMMHVPAAWLAVQQERVTARRLHAPMHVPPSHVPVV